MATETPEQLEQQAEADFAAAFETPTPPDKETKAPAVDDQGKPVETEVKAEVVEEKPVEYVQITKEERDELLALRGRTAELGTKFDRVAGTFGNLQEIVKKLQAGTATPSVVRKFKDSLKRTREDFPDLADRIEADLEEAMAGQGDAPAAVNQEEISVSVAKRVKELRDAEQVEVLNEAYPGWGDLVGKYGDGKNDFRIWLATQDAAYKDQIENTTSALIIGRAIDKYNASKKAAAAVPAKKPDLKVVARQDRITGAVQPKGDGRPPPTKDTAEDDLNKGFYS